MALPYTKEHYDSILEAAGREDLLGDERYATGRARIANADFLYGQIGAMMAERTTAEWLEFFRRHDVPAAEVVTLDDMVSALPLEVHPEAGLYRTIPPPVRFEKAPQAVRRPAPLIGAHTEEVLEEAGYDAQGIASLRQSGAFGRIPVEFS
jgi:formyl-CoA transferase